MVSILREASRLNEVDNFIYDINTGMQFDKSKVDKVPYQEKVNFLAIQDICIQPMADVEIDNW